MSSRDKDREKDREKDRDREREKEKEKERDAVDSRDKGEKEKEREKEREKEKERGFHTYSSNGNTYSLDEPMGMDIGMGLDDRQSVSIFLSPMLCNVMS
jgi:hypothetical protein